MHGGSDLHREIEAMVFFCRMAGARRGRWFALVNAPVHNRANPKPKGGTMTRIVRQRLMSRRTVLTGTAGLAGTAALGPAAALAQEAGKTGIPASVITNPPRQWGPRNPRSTRIPMSSSSIRRLTR
jgi:hypothetical protein